MAFLPWEPLQPHVLSKREMWAQHGGGGWAHTRNAHRRIPATRPWLALHRMAPPLAAREAGKSHLLLVHLLPPTKQLLSARSGERMLSVGICSSGTPYPRLLTERSVSQPFLPYVFSGYNSTSCLSHPSFCPFIRF